MGRTIYIIAELEDQLQYKSIPESRPLNALLQQKLYAKDSKMSGSQFDFGGKLCSSETSSLTGRACIDNNNALGMTATLCRAPNASRIHAVLRRLGRQPLSVIQVQTVLL